ncbi:hypothetical protein GCM10023107_01370 [Actinoplanes octamycinicus]
MLAADLADSTTEQDDSTYSSLIEELGSESFSERENATSTIWGLGSVMLPYLKSASDSDDPELAFTLINAYPEYRSWHFPDH